MKIHSYVGVVTNSSTQIYSKVSNIQIIKDFIDQILEDIGVDKKADDLYNFEVEVEDTDILYERLLDDMEEEEYEKYAALDYTDRWEQLERDYPNIEELLEEYDNEECPIDTALKITTKDGQRRISNFLSIYEQEAWWDG